MKRALVLAALLLLPAAAAAQPAVFLVRHAERADGGMAASGADPDLSDAGRARAESLATVLKDARITQIFVSPLKRTQQTAAPIAKLLGLEPSVVPPADATALASRIKAATAATGNVLVVGHSNTLPPLLKALGVEEPIAIAESEFDQLFIVTRGATPSLLRIRYR